MNTAILIGTAVIELVLLVVKQWKEL